MRQQSKGENKGRQRLQCHVRSSFINASSPRVSANRSLCAEEVERDPYGCHKRGQGTELAFNDSEPLNSLLTELSIDVLQDWHVMTAHSPPDLTGDVKYLLSLAMDRLLPRGIILQQ